MSYRLLCFAIFLCSLVAAEMTTESAASMLNIANEYYGEFYLGKNKSVVLVLGNKNVGKSVIAKLLTTDSTNINLKDGLLEFNGQRTINRTNVPTLMIDASSNTSFYDCPVINDPDSIIDLISGRSIHELIEFANEFKIVFVIQSISNVIDSVDFFRLAENVVNLFDDIQKYSDGIALIVRQIEQNINDNELAYDEDTDRELINKCVEFLINAEIQLFQQKFSSPNAQRLNSDKISFINALLKNERIKVFRTSMKLEAIKLQKDIILRMINNDLRFIKKKNDYFSCHINNNTRQMVPHLLNELKHQLINELPKAIGTIHRIYVQQEVRDSVTLHAMKEIILNSTQFNPAEIRLPTKIDANKIISPSLTEKIAFFHFLQRFSMNNGDRVINISNELKTQLYSQVRDSLFNEVTNIFREMKRFFVHIGKQFYLDIDVLTKIIQKSHQQLSQMQASNYISFANQLSKVINELEINGLNGHMRRMSRNLEFMQLLGNENALKPETILNELTQLTAHANDLKIWYNFVLEVRNQLSTYEMQRNKQMAPISFLSVFIIGNDEDTVEPRIIDVKPAIDCLPASINREVIENIRINRYMLKALQIVWSSSMSNNSIECTSNRLIVKGNFISISTIISTANCWLQVKYIDIFAFYKVFIDADIDRCGQNVSLSIISPIWEIISPSNGNKTNRYIRLTGQNATYVMGPAQNGAIRINRDGRNGLNGIRGGVGGNFLAIGNQFIDDEYLIVDLSGGNGGIGQKGGNGKT